MERIVFLPDEEDAIVCELKAQTDHFSAVFVAGGLGPTSDDVTRVAVSRAGEAPLIFNQTIWTDLENRFKGRTLSSSNRKQAMIPRGYSILKNRNGTAPGFYGRIGGADIYVLPGPPGELIPMFESSVYSLLQKTFQLEELHELEATSFLVPESELEDVIVKAAPADIKWSTRIQDHMISVTLAGKMRQDLESTIQKVIRALGNHRIKVGSVEPGETLFDLLRRKKMKCAFAESCTGGLLSALITDLPGSSEVFWGSVTVYSNQAKKAIIGIPDEILNKSGAVSGETVSAMTRGIIEVSGSDLGIAVSGVAGPDGGTPEKPVGTVWIGAALSAGGELIRRYHFPGGRKRIRNRSAVAAFLLAEELMLDELENSRGTKK